MAPLVPDQISCINGGVEGFLRGAVGGCIAGFIFCDGLPYKPQVHNGAGEHLSIRRFCTWIKKRRQNWGARCRSAAQYSCALAFWNCKAANLSVI